MVDRIKLFFTKNIVWKLVSLCTAAVLWFTVVSWENPVRTELFQVPLSIRNEQALQANSLVLMNRQELQNRTTGIMVRGALSDLNTLRSSMASFQAYIDLGPIDISQAADIHEPLSITIRYELPPFLNDAAYTIMSPPETVRLVLDRYVVQGFPVSVAREGSVMPGFIHHQPVVSPERVSVSGPETVINTIDRVQTVVDLSDADTDISRFLGVHVIDVNGTDITSSVILNTPSIMVQIGVARYGEVPVILPNIFGNPAEGYVFMGVSVSPDTIEVVGDEYSLNSMQRTGIALRPVGIDGISEGFVIRNDMREYLMDTALHVRNLTPHETVTQVIIEPLVTRGLEFNLRDIEIIDESEELELYQIYNAPVVVLVQAAQSIAEALTTGDFELHATITDAALAAGRAVVEVDLPEGVEQIGETRIILIVAEESAGIYVGDM
ncbi:MAG: CdaR family protein [Defluviitaleaceae bacterium]|nr:CdaR family protein [Defluviitaleaceae bacterium]